MWSGLAADVLVVLHMSFVLFVALGGLLALRWPRVCFVHLPAAIWGAAIELGGWICPLTPLELELRRHAGEVGYTGSFVDHYLLPVLYPSGLDRRMQVVLGIGVVLVNGALYLRLWCRARSRRKSSRS